MQKIEFNQERDFSKVYGDTLAFIKQNFKGLFGAIVLISGPFLLVSGASLGYMQSSIMSLSRGMFSGGDFLSGFYTWFAVVIFFSIVSATVLYSTVYNYMILYYEKPLGERITVSEVGRRVLGNFGRVMGSMFIFTVLMVIIIAVAAFAMIGIGSLMGVIGGILVALALTVFFIIYTPVLVYYIPAAFFVVVRDEVSIFEGWGKVNRCLKGNFWWTWLIMFIAIIVLYIINLVFSLPATIVVMTNTFTRIREGSGINGGGNSVLLIVLYTLSVFMSYCTSSILLVLSAFNFLGTEEKHEGKGLISRIEEIK